MIFIWSLIFMFALQSGYWAKKAEDAILADQYFKCAVFLFFAVFNIVIVVWLGGVG